MMSLLSLEIHCAEAKEEIRQEKIKTKKIHFFTIPLVKKWVIICVKYGPFKANTYKFKITSINQEILKSFIQIQNEKIKMRLKKQLQK